MLLTNNKVPPNANVVPIELDPMILEMALDMVPRLVEIVFCRRHRHRPSDVVAAQEAYSSRAITSLSRCAAILT
jgi:hypothetical protein